MGWAQLEASLNLQAATAEAEENRTPSDPGDSCDESTGILSQESCESPAWWADQLLQHARDFSFASPESVKVRVLSGCTGLSAETFALKDPVN